MSSSPDIPQGLPLYHPNSSLSNRPNYYPNISAEQHAAVCELREMLRSTKVLPVSEDKKKADKEKAKALEKERKRRAKEGLPELEGDDEAKLNGDQAGTDARNLFERFTEGSEHDYLKMVPLFC
jgi:hypothetical protein